MSKGKLEARPIFHFTERRIEAHICICFIAYKVYKELDRLISVNRIGMSVDKVLDVAKTIVTVRVDMPQNGELYTETLFLTENHQRIKPLFDMNDDEKMTRVGALTSQKTISLCSFLLVCVLLRFCTLKDRFRTIQPKMFHDILCNR